MNLINYSRNLNTNPRVILPSFADDAHFNGVAKTPADLIEIMRKGMLCILQVMRGINFNSC